MTTTAVRFHALGSIADVVFHAKSKSEWLIVSVGEVGDRVFLSLHDANVGSIFTS
jgi:hypothetical protein